MKALLSPLALLVLLCLAQVRPARAQLGFAAGLNLDRLNDIELTSGRATFDNSTGWHVEAWLDLPLGALALRPGVRYLDAGALYRGLTDRDRDLGDAFLVNLVEIPLNLRLRFGRSALTPYVVGGPVLRFPFVADNQLNDDLRTISVAGGLGFGVEMPLGGLRLYPELAYTFGISGFVHDEFRIGGRRFVIDNDTQYLNTVMLRLGLGL